MDAKEEEKCKSVGQRISRYRNQAGLKQKELAEAVGQTPKTIGAIEHGHQTASTLQLLDIGSQLNVNPAFFFIDYDTPLEYELSIYMKIRLYEGLSPKDQKILEEVFKALWMKNHPGINYDIYLEKMLKEYAEALAKKKL